MRNVRLQSEIYVPDVPPPIWAEPSKPLRDSVVALVTAAGVHLKHQSPFILAGDFTFREIPGDIEAEQLMVTHGGYDNADVNKDINCMFPIDRLRELHTEGFIGGISPVMIGFMGGGGNQEKFRQETGPQIAALLKDKGVDIALLTAV